MKTRRRVKLRMSLLATLALVAALSGCNSSGSNSEAAAPASTSAVPSDAASTVSNPSPNPTPTNSGGSSSASAPTTTITDTANSGEKSVTLSWLAPTENIDGSALVNLSGYVIYYGRTKDSMTNTIEINTVGISTYVVDNLNTGTWYFAVAAVSNLGEKSSPSSPVDATI